MVISFEEKDRAVIEAKGMTIIEFKRFLYKDAKTAVKTLEYLVEYAKCVLKAWNAFKKQFLKAVDSVKLIVEQISDYICHPTSFRYKVVKFLSRCTGMDIYKLWKMTRRI